MAFGATLTGGKCDLHPRFWSIISSFLSHGLCSVSLLGLSGSSGRVVSQRDHLYTCLLPLHLPSCRRLSEEWRLLAAVPQVPPKCSAARPCPVPVASFSLRQYWRRKKTLHKAVKAKKLSAQEGWPRVLVYLHCILCMVKNYALHHWEHLSVKKGGSWFRNAQGTVIPNSFFISVTLRVRSALTWGAEASSSGRIVYTFRPSSKKLSRIHSTADLHYCTHTIDPRTVFSWTCKGSAKLFSLQSHLLLLPPITDFIWCPLYDFLILLCVDNGRSLNLSSANFIYSWLFFFFGGNAIN